MESRGSHARSAETKSDGAESEDRAHHSVLNRALGEGAGTRDTFIKGPVKQQLAKQL